MQQAKIDEEKIVSVEGICDGKLHSKPTMSLNQDFSPKGDSIFNWGTPSLTLPKWLNYKPFLAFWLFLEWFSLMNDFRLKYQLGSITKVIAWFDWIKWPLDGWIFNKRSLLWLKVLVAGHRCQNLLIQKRLFLKIQK